MLKFKLKLKSKGMAIFEVLMAMVFFSLLLNGIYRHSFGEKGIMAVQQDIEHKSELIQYRAFLCRKIQAELQCNDSSCSAMDLVSSGNSIFSAVFAEGYPYYDSGSGVVYSNFSILKEGTNVEQVDCRF